ncbi:MAG: glycosyltransferase [Candidatus Aenigmatarchaeota archaeon]|nr:MAG: glycosyltransferase [Candidatus Aenigmarchaeota archaeon]
MNVSVAVPAYNEESVLGACLRCLKEQTVPCEIVVCDNNSRDRTYQIASRYADRVVREKRQGVAHAFNAASKAATGELIAFTGADCCVPHDWIEKYIPAFHDPHVIACFGPVHSTGKSYRRTMKYYSIFHRVLVKLKIAWGISDANMIVRKRVLEHVGYFDPKVQMMEDSHLISRIRRYGKFRFFVDNIVMTSPRKFEKEKLRRIFFNYFISLVILKLTGKLSHKRLSNVR